MLAPSATIGTLRALGQLSRSVRGGEPHALREADRVRSAGPSLSGRVVVLDPGHSSTSPGATAHGLVEADLTLDLARRVEGRLAAGGVNVVLTRGLHGDPDEVMRAETANALGADLLISLHCDRTDSDKPHGVASYHFGTGTGTTSTVGEHLASLVQREVVARTDMLDCQVHAKTWEILRLTRMPAVRLELGHLTSARDAARLADPGFRDAVAEALLVAVQRLYLPPDLDPPTGVFRLADLAAL